jgi:antimicrobial peptide ABC transporter, permease protein
MLGKLSIRNAKRQAKDYIIYFITVIISVALMFSFNSIATSKDISELSSSMQYFSKSITGISIIIIFVMAWLINYTMKFMLEKRSKEFGTYQILGLEKKDISKMFTLENLIIGFLAFIVGIIVGTFLYQIFTSIIMNLFNQIYEVKISFDIKAIGMTAVYFFGIFLLVLLNCRRKIKKTKVYDLLYASKKNENNIVKKSKGNIFVFILSIILLLSALFITYKQFLDVNQMSDKQIFIAIILLIIGIYLFYIGLSSFIIKRFINNKKRKYKNNNMFLYRNLASKINTMSFTTATIALMFTIILIGGNVALLMNNMLNNEIEMGYPYEIMISTADGDFSKYKEYIEDNAEVKAMYEYKMYYIKETGISKALEDTILKDKTGNIENVFSLTDYNQLREIAGYDKLELQENEILINCMKTLEKPFKEYIKENNEINMFGQKMTIKDVRSENIAQVGFNGSYYAIIVPDKLIPLAEFEEESIRNQENGEYQIYTFDFNYKLVVQTEETTDENFYYELIDFIITKEEKINVDINGEEEEVSSIKYLRKCTN